VPVLPGIYEYIYRVSYYNFRQKLFALSRNKYYLLKSSVCNIKEKMQYALIKLGKRHEIVLENSSLSLNLPKWGKVLIHLNANYLIPRLLAPLQNKNNLHISNITAKMEDSGYSIRTRTLRIFESHRTAFVRKFRCGIYYKYYCPNNCRH